MALLALLGVQSAALTPALYAQAASELAPPRSIPPTAPNEASLAAEPGGRALGSPIASRPFQLVPDWNFEVTLGTIFPIAVGGSVRALHTRSAVFVDLYVGASPNAYASFAGEAAAAYGADIGPRQLLVGLLDGAGVGRLSVGLRPFAGFEVSLGYSLLVAQPTLPRTTLEAATGQSFFPAGDRVALSLVVHAVHLELGYSLVLFDHLVLRAALGGTLAVAGDFRVDVPASMRMPDGPVETMEREIGSSIGGRVFLPTLRVEAGGRF